MTLLDHYLHAVRVYLPRRPSRDDILDELADLLQSKLEERARELGRPLTEIEQQAVLIEHGNPTTVASGYGGTNLGLAFGRQIIGPEVFPVYALVLILQFTCTLAAAIFLSPYMPEPLLSHPSRIVSILAAQLVLTTTIFAMIDALQRRECRRTRWVQFISFPPSHLQRIPHWQSTAGLTLLTLAAIWWASIPARPALVLGSAAQSLQLTPAWQTFYWPVLLLLTAGAVQRALTLIRPDWNVLQFVTRLCTNGCMLAMLVPLLEQFPFVTVAPGAIDAAATLRMHRINDALWWNVLSTGGLYWGVTFGWHAWLCLQFVRSRLRRSRVVLA
jgi:hypothetical protein